jgi:uncharacterized protein (DUF1800 family)
MAYFADESVKHLLRRAGFGASKTDLGYYGELRFDDAVRLLVNFEQIDDDVDGKIGNAAYVGVTVRGSFQPNTVINDARQRWLFRMVHSNRPLQEKMTLFWHNHFATAYSKLAGAYSSSDATRLMASRPSEDPVGLEGQVETIRRMAVGSFRDLVVAMAKDPAMLIWLDGRYNTKTKPQENFGRELMELFSMGVGFYTESDVYAAARVFSGWNLTRTANLGTDPYPSFKFVYNAAQHETAAKTFSFPIYTDGSRTIQSRSADAGLQDGLDLITAVVRHPETAERLVRRLWNYFVSEMNEPSAAFMAAAVRQYLTTDYNIRGVLDMMLRSAEFRDERQYFTKYSWPAEFIARSIKEVGWSGFSVDTAVSQMINMGQVLYEPPDVAGWEQGPGWISTGGMLARMNYAATLAKSQANGLATWAVPYARAADAVLSAAIDRLSPSPFGNAAYDELRAYLLASGSWTGSDAQVRAKVPGLVHLIVGSGEYVFI